MLGGETDTAVAGASAAITTENSLPELTTRPCGTGIPGTSCREAATPACQGQTTESQRQMKALNSSRAKKKKNSFLESSLCPFFRDPVSKNRAHTSI